MAILCELSLSFFSFGGPVVSELPGFATSESGLRLMSSA
jgi:hypothetical protein